MKRRAIFRPTRLDNLRPEMVPVIGEEFDVQYMGILDEDHPLYPGQAIYMEAAIPAVRTQCFWMPEEDLEFIDP